MALTATLASTTRSTNRSTSRYGDHQMPTTGRYRRQRGFTLGYDFRSFMRRGQVLLAESRTATMTCVSGGP
jgi:hypothetical protein